MNRPVHITKTSRGIDAAHRVPNHESKCYNLHGHRYELIVHAEGNIVEYEGAPDEGMLVDFGILGSWLQDWHNVLDHALILYKNDPLVATMDTVARVHNMKLVTVEYIPTAENIARMVYEDVVEKAGNHFRPNDLMITNIECWETPTSMARYPA